MASINLSKKNTFMEMTNVNPRGLPLIKMLKNLRHFRIHNCLAVLVVLTCSALSVFANSPSPEDKPPIDIMAAITAADKYVRDELKFPKYYLAWVSLERFNDEMDRKWITAWYPEDENHERKSDCVLVGIEIRDGKIIAEKKDKRTGYGFIDKTIRAIDLATALKASYTFSKDNKKLKNHYIWRAGLGKIDGSEEIFWIVCWWPEIHAEANYSWPVVIVNMKKDPVLVDALPTWLALEKIHISPRKMVLPPAKSE